MARQDLPRTKTPTERFRISLDFKNDLKAGDTVASHSVTATRTDTGVSTPEVLGTVVRSGTVIEVMVQAGTNGQDYALLFQVTTTQGDMYEGIIVVPVRIS